MSNDIAIKAANIVRDAHGKIIGRTRLQKIAYLLTITGLEDGLNFVYKHYGPYSDDLADATRIAKRLGILDEVEHQASWGGFYSTYTFPGQLEEIAPLARRELAVQAANADAIELELAATAAFLSKAGFDDPWTETARRKPEKASDERLSSAKALYRRLAQVQTPTKLPAI